jgi:ABC-type Na+ efflux pump permease subunit
VLQRIRKKRRQGGFFLLLLIVIVIVAVIIISGMKDSKDTKSQQKRTDVTSTANDGPTATVQKRDSTSNSSRSSRAKIGGSSNRNAKLSNGFTAAAEFEPALSSHDFLDDTFAKSENPMTKLYLPNYAYSQSLVYSEGDVNVFGQVRILGGVVSKGRTQLGHGAMITAVPEYVTRRTTPTQSRYHIAEWKEL